MKIRVLIVEDERIIAEDIRMTLESLGFYVTAIAGSSDAAFQALEQEKADIILMDVHIQGNMDGIETAKQIAETHHIPAVFLTAYADQDTVQRIRQASAYGFIIKPVSPDSIQGTLELAIDRHRMDKALQTREKELMESRQKYQILLNSQHDAVFLHPLLEQGFAPFEEVNDVACERYGYTHEEFSQLTAFDITLDKDVSVHAKKAHRHELLDRGHMVFNTTHIARDGSRIDVEISSTILELHNRKFILAVARDISDRLRIQNEQEKLIQKIEAQHQELERFSYTFSHDLKNPLVTMNGFLNLLQQKLTLSEREDVKHDIEQISGAVNQMDRLLKDLLHLSQNGHLINPFKRCSFQELTESAVEKLKNQLRLNNVSIDIQPDLPDVFCDEVRIVEVLINLMDNAVKFMGPSKPVVMVGSRIEKGENVFFVQDNGIGIDVKHQNRVFNLFEQLNPQKPGSGIGLAIVKRIIENHEGRVWVESEGEGCGSLFCFTLPEPKSDDDHH